MIPLYELTESHLALVNKAAVDCDLVNPVAFNPHRYSSVLIDSATKKRIFDIGGLLIRSWSPTRVSHGGIEQGIIQYEVQSESGLITFASVRVHFSANAPTDAMYFFVCAAADYQRLYRYCLRADRTYQINDPHKPILPDDVATILYDNTINFLLGDRIEKIIAMGGRPKRGIILSGPPGNGKTMACRWLWSQCKVHDLEWKIITPDDFQQARSRNAVYDLLEIVDRGIIFFDDMDSAMREREMANDSSAQAMLLSALDGIRPAKGVVYVFTTNCQLRDMDKAFRRPGRIDVVLEFDKPNAHSRASFFDTWHPDLQVHLDHVKATKQTDGFSFAELDELRNLMIMALVDRGQNNAWDNAFSSYKVNRREFKKALTNRPGFGDVNE